MLKNLVPRLACPECAHPGRLVSHAFTTDADGDIQDGVLVCPRCGMWYTIDNGLLELVPRTLADSNDLTAFDRRWRQELASLGLETSHEGAAEGDFEAQFKQREHFDWYADNGEQSYREYQTTPFWTAVDEAAFGEWRQQFRPGAWLLDVGCANGRSAFRLVESGLTVVGFDISKKMVRQAIERARREGRQTVTAFLVADGNSPPFADASFDYVLTYGVLHHLPDPAVACHEFQRILKPGGIYFGSENNRSIFRGIFDWSMKVAPLWTEEAGAEPLISRQMLTRWHAELPAEIHSSTSVFVLPHLLNFVGRRFAARLLRISDAVASRVPFLNRHGGLILYEVHKQAAQQSLRKHAGDDLEQLRPAA